MSNVEFTATEVGAADGMIGARGSEGDGRAHYILLGSDPHGAYFEFDDQSQGSFNGVASVVLNANSAVFATRQGIVITVRQGVGDDSWDTLTSAIRSAFPTELFRAADDWKEQLRTSWEARDHEDAAVALAWMPADQRPPWAARILEMIQARSGSHHALIDQVIALARDQSRWSEAHGLFSAVRSEVLVLDEKATKRSWFRRRVKNVALPEDEETLSLLLATAERVAKITYNATVPLDPFDQGQEDALIHWLIRWCRRLDGSVREQAWIVLLPECRPRDDKVTR